MSKKPLATVFARLIYKYDVPIGFEESAFDKNHNHYDFETNVPPTDLKKEYAADRDFISSYPKFTEHLLTLDFDDESLATVIDSIVRQMQNYSWQERNGVINIFPNKGRDPIFQRLLDLPINRFNLSKGAKVGFIQGDLYDLPEIRDFFNRNKVMLVTERGYSLLFIDRPLEQNLDFGTLKFGELLNRITACKRGGWIIRQGKDRVTNEKTIELLI